MSSKIGGGVRELVLDRPRVRNALDLETTERLLGALDEVASDPGTAAVLLRGEGPGFCAGSDVKEMARVDLETRLRIAECKAALMRRLACLERPVVAAVHGFALGGGFMLAIGCDVVISASDAVWRLPEVELGFFPPWGLEALLMRVSVARARRLVWGETALTGAEAARLGLADEAVAGEATLARAREVARRLASLPAGPVRATKRFFAQHGAVEGLDAIAREMYRVNCEEGVAEATFRRLRA
ncbi:MAG: enoyl-CoA hydratase/isomerase family protein [Betaproteobacteria bacterium]|nr:enoyl-CoA hydratase/isomerase family protein [Betaproteobacteria bacterium]